MPAPANVTEFVDVVRRSGLVPEDRLQAELARLRTDPSPPQNVDQVAQSMVRGGVLTRFQAKQMKLGRYKRFEIAGKYRLMELLGIGGMGAVYLCEHQFMKRLVALKVLPVEKMEDPSALARFYREARAVAAMDHPNIVRAYDIDKFEQLHFLVMEYVDGTSLQEIVARHGPIAPRRAANYVAQSAQGLQHAHELGLVHRDIKPGNLLLERTGTVKILDMGLARFFDQKNDNLTEKFDNNCVLGTADYLAPEQAVSNVVDIRADIYALGGSMYFMLTGQSPFPDGTIASKLMAHQTREPKPVGEFRKDVPPELLAVLHKMMRKEPDERYQTPAEVSDALGPWSEMEIDSPPVHEMPDLCPAVLALAGHQDRPVKGGNSSKFIPTQAARPSSGKPASNPAYSRPGSSGAKARPAVAADQIVAQSEVPTARAVATAPLPNFAQGRQAPPPPPHKNPPAAPQPALFGSSEVVFAPAPAGRSVKSAPAATRPAGRAWWVYALFALAALMLVVTGAVAAVLVLKAGGLG